MPVELPSLLAFQPHYYRGGAVKHHLPFLYDLTVTVRPERIVVLGFGEGEAFFTFCQAVRENGLSCDCTAIWRGAALDEREADQAWQQGKKYADESYREFARLSSNDPETAVNEFVNGEVDLL